MDEELAEKLLEELPIRIASLSLEHMETNAASGKKSRTKFNNKVLERVLGCTENDTKQLHANMKIVQDQLMKEKIQERRMSAVLVQKLLRGRQSPFRTIALQKEHWNKAFREIFIMARQIRVRNIRTDRAAVVCMWYMKDHYVSKHVRRVKPTRLSGGIHKTNQIKICVHEKDTKIYAKL